MSTGHIEQTDSDIVVHSLAEPERFGALVDRHLSAIYRYLARRLGADLAEDLSAEVFTTAFAARARYEASRADARPWLFGITTNLIRRHVRAENRRLQAYQRAQSQVTHHQTSSDDLVEHLDQLAALEKVAVAFSELDSDHRDALYLVAVAEISFKDAAIALGITLGTAHSRVARAREHLRDSLSGSGQEKEGEPRIRTEGHR